MKEYSEVLEDLYPSTDDGKEYLYWEDFLGQQYTKGDLIVYSSSYGRGNQLTLGRVLSINRINSNGERIGHDQHNYNSTPRTITFVPGASVSVQPIVDSRRGARTERNWKTSELKPGKKVTIGMIENIIKVDSSQVIYDEIEEYIDGLG